MSVLKASVTDRLDAAGTFQVELPATDPRLFPVAAVTNLVDNPSLETDGAGWSFDAGLTAVRTSGGAAFETWSYKVEGGIQTAQGVRIGRRDGSKFGVVAGRRYTMVLHAKNDAASSGDVAGHFGIEWYDADDVEVGHDFTVPLVTLLVGGAWARQSWSAIAPVGAVTARINFEETGGWSAGRWLWFDGAMFYEGDAEVGYGDGAQTGWAWLGTAQESESRRAGSAGPLSRGTIWRHYREGEGFAFAGLAEEIVTTPDGGKLISGPTLLGQLLYDNTLRGYTFSSQTLDTVADALLANTGWTRNGSVTTTITVRFDMESRLKALSDAVTQVGSHFRENVTEVAGALVKTLDIGSAALGNASGVVISGGNPDSLLADDAALALAEDVKVTESSADIWNWMLPLGAGDGTTQLTLQFSTRTTPYRILKRRDLNGSRMIYFIADYTVWDGFERTGTALGSTDTAQAWVAATGTWALQNWLVNGYATPTVLVGGVARLVVESSVADGVVGVTLVTVITGSGPIFRYSDADNHFFVARTAAGYELVRRQATVETQLAAYTGGSAADDIIEVVLDGPTISVVRNGTVIMTASDTFNQTATQHGLRATTANTPNFDDFYVAGSTTSIALYGRRMRPFVAKEIGALSNTPTALTTAANALYDLAATHLTYWKEAPTVYGFRVRGLAASVKPGDSVRFRYRGVAQHWEVGAVYIDVDADFYILQRTRNFDADGSESSDVVISSVARMLETSNDLVIGKIEETARVVRSHVATSVSNYSAGPIVEELESGTPMQFDVFIDDNVLHLLRCKVRFKPRAIRSPVDVTDAESAPTSSAGGSHSHTVTIAAHNHGLSGVTTNATSTPSGGGATSGSESAHKHLVAALSPSSAWSDPAHRWPFDVLNEAGDVSFGLLIGSGNSLGASGEAWTSSTMHSHTHTTPDHTHPNHTHSYTAQTTDNGGASTPTSSTETTHTHTVPAHDHALAFGIFEGTSASSIEIWINGVDRTAALGGPWGAAATVDITTYLLDAGGLVVQGVHAIEFRSATLGRVEAWVDLIVAVQAVIG